MKASENGLFVGDISVPEMLYAVTIRSPVPSGILKGIECPPLPDSYRLITAEDIPGHNTIADFPVPVLVALASNVSYSGEPVAILVGDHKSKLEYLARLITVTIEETPEVTETLVQRNIISGDADAAFAENAQVVSGSYHSGIQAHWYPEPNGALADPLASPKTMTVYTATQWAYHVKRSVEQVLGGESGKVKVKPCCTTMHLDGKLWYPSLVSCHAALAAHLSGKAVQLILTGEEDFMYTPKRNAAEIHLHSALGSQGEILATKVKLSLNLGAYGIFKNEIIDQSCLGTLGLYDHQAFAIDAEGIRTNLPPQGPLAGFGLSQGFFAAERHISRIAELLGHDPATWRKNNFLGAQDSEKKKTLAIGSVLKENIPLPELIDKAAAMGDYYRKWASYELLRNSRKGKPRVFSGDLLRGIGIATAYQGSGFLYNDKSVASSNVGNCTVELTLEKDGSLEIAVSSALSELKPIGEKSALPLPETWINAASEILGVKPDAVRLRNDTLSAPDAGAATLSRNISVVTKLIEKCCQAIRKQRFRKPLPITVKRAEKFSTVAAWGDTERLVSADAFAQPSWAAVVLEIELDPISITPNIRGIWLAADGGKILSPRRAKSALRTGIIQALGWTSREQLAYISGKIPNEQYRAYDIIPPLKVPPITVDFIASKSSVSKGIGDLPFSCVPAAYVQAVSQAMDHHFETIPLDAQEIWNEAGSES